MFYNDIIELISKHLADEIISETEMLSYMDRVIDDINVRLNTIFPTFTEYKEANSNVTNELLNYTAIPDKYIRTVVVPGAAFKYYTTDEEGGYSAPKYEEDYKQNLFYMERDFSLNVPAQYRGEVEYIDGGDYPVDNQGFIEMGDFGDGIDLRGGFY